MSSTRVIIPLPEKDVPFSLLFRLRWKIE